MVPVGEWLKRSHGVVDGQVPCLSVVDADDGLRRLVVDERLVQAARRCLEDWHRLQEFGGIRNSHAQRLLASERARWEEMRRQEIAAMPGTAGTPDATAVADVGPAPVAAPGDEPERSPDEAWIETVRCSTCNECTQINDRVFAYDENQQAYIKDLAAGSYRELIEAAESCQLAIIHPGKPRDPNEPGLKDLLERAEPFL
jgi:ferredoxin